MKPSQERYNIGIALVDALEPLIDVCVETGITVPEVEGLLRVAFVLRAFKKLPPHPKTKRPPTGHRVALATGLRGEEVRRIRTEGVKVAAKAVMQERDQTVSKSGRVVHGWSTDVHFMTSGGLPLDLPLRRNKERRSFTDLVRKYAPSTHAGALLKEMVRRGQVQVIDDEIVRFRRSAARHTGLTPTAVAEAAKRLKQLGETLFTGLVDETSPTFYEESETIKMSAAELALIRPILERRMKAFLRSVQAEFGPRAARGVEDSEFGVGVFSWRSKT